MIDADRIALRTFLESKALSIPERNIGLSVRRVWYDNYSVYDFEHVEEDEDKPEELT